MLTIRAIIIEDEIPSQEVLVNYIDQYCKDVKVVAVANSIKTGIEAINTFHPNLVFLDIRLPDGLSFNLFDHLPNVDFKVIFITAYSEYAVKAFRISAIDYLLKPVKIDDLIEAINKARMELMIGLDMKRLEVLFKNLNDANEGHDQLVVHENTGFRVIELKDIIFCKADGYCTVFCLTGQEKVMSSKILKYYDDLLPDSAFIRVHNSYIVNIKHVKSYNSDGLIGLTDGHTASLGNTFKKKFAERFNKFK